MLKYIFIFLFTLSAFAQNDSVAPQNISVISAEKLNVVYRGVDNPIKIAVPGAKSFTATAPGLSPDESKGTGNYILNPGAGTEVIVTLVAQMPDSTSKVEKKAFRIMGLPPPDGTIEGFENEGLHLKMTKEELKNAVISIHLPNFLFEVKIPVVEFAVKIPRHKIITVEGNTFPEEIKKVLAKVKKKSVISITHIRYPSSPNAMPKRVTPFTVEITD
ncbi:GldM family protein [Flavobacterium sp. RHBU_24]|uniref:GldM family protein n=1 Tax=Flavobacterium sp. RHBU_24 TaxID=3391185 RepID=UPI0039851307